MTCLFCSYLQYLEVFVLPTFPKVGVNVFPTSFQLVSNVAYEIGGMVQVGFDVRSAVHQR